MPASRRIRNNLPAEPFRDAPAHSAIETVLLPRTRDLGGGFEVRRALPSARRRMVGPFIFLDQMGPGVFRSGEGLDVRPHPHIGLATVTYLFEGEIVHRDSLGTVQVIRPGAVNWMTAGRGIVHSERSSAETRAVGGRLFGIQTWVALPRRDEEAEPGFVHTPAEGLPVVEGDGIRARVIAGALFGARSPLRTFSETIYADLEVSAGARLEIPAAYEERGVFVVEGVLEESGTAYGSGQLVLLRPGVSVLFRSPSSARAVLVGGEAMDGPRLIWWNFVASTPERIEEAAAEWRSDRFPPVPGETDRIPLPAQPRIARYP